MHITSARAARCAASACLAACAAPDPTPRVRNMADTGCFEDFSNVDTAEHYKQAYELLAEEQALFKDF